MASFIKDNAVKEEKAKKVMADEIMEKAIVILEEMEYLREVSKYFIDSRPGILADRLEDMSEPITNEVILRNGGEMKSFDGFYYYPILVNGIIPTWDNGYKQLYIKVDGGYQYSTCTLNGKILTENDPRNSCNHFTSPDRDFIAIDFRHQLDEIVENILQLMDSL